MKNQTIAAISTPFGKGGIAVIRISGENAVGVADKMFFPVSGKKLASVTPNTAVYGKIISEGKHIDDGVAVVFRAPRSYTGEDTVEISCHGGILLTERVLKTAFTSGAYPAGAGEFTERAFLNGKISLTEAEAVIGLIDAENEEKLSLCASHASGVLKRRTEDIYASVVKLLSSVYVGLDYPEEDLEEVSDTEFITSLREIYAKLSETANTYREGRAVAEGVLTVLLGKPNTGKSSLLNAWLCEDRAIVTDIPGTTRDVIEEKVSAGRITLRLSDTAGIRESADAVEKIGIEKAVKKAEEAELIIALFDLSRDVDDEDRYICNSLKDYSEKGKSVIAVFNKTDLDNGNGNFEARSSEIRAMLPTDTAVCNVSAKNGDGLDALKKVAEGLFVEGRTDYSKTAVIANARQFSAVCSARDAVLDAINAFESGVGSDVCGMDLERALMSLGEVDGRSVSEEITSEIFKNFCVGK